ncbi:NAD-dependent protein deacylase [Defluviitalea phaphyphila]|uniref:NAD-dependent protein deacylase n=1 Tax=Defluviitalea phaphyphila TaxID=1473580 RepID=UPI000A437BCE|nr:NAD-dependent protein deacylase [Defluviitalea phaphyphila]
MEQLKNIINESNNIVFLGGAGVSTESNIPDFRSSQGLYSGKEQYPPEVILSHSFFIEHTDLFYDFYKKKMIYKDAKPNNAHIALAKLEEMGKLKAVITQNIDGLHQLAGSKNVLELHGSIHRNYCMKCGKFYSLEDILNDNEKVPTCKECGGIIKPDVVLYEEALNSEILQKSIEYIANADVFIVGGTSLVVYPAAGLINYYKGNKLILINKSSTPFDNIANYVINESIGDVLKKLIL